MNTPVIVPTLGESVAEATVAKWLKKVGDSVTMDEVIVELETDKVSVEVTSPNSGYISEIKTDVGETVEVGSQLGSISKSQIKKSIKSNEKNLVKEEIVKDRKVLSAFTHALIKKDIKPNLIPYIFKKSSLLSFLI